MTVASNVRDVTVSYVMIVECSPPRRGTFGALLFQQFFEKLQRFGVLAVAQIPNRQLTHFD